MYAVAFDLVVADTENNHPKGVTQAYTEIAAVLGEHGWENTALVACKEVFTLATMKTWRTCFLLSSRCVAGRGFQSRCATFALSESSNGRTLPPSSRVERVLCRKTNAIANKLLGNKLRKRSANQKVSSGLCSCPNLMRLRQINLPVQQKNCAMQQPSGWDLPKLQLI